MQDPFADRRLGMADDSTMDSSYELAKHILLASADAAGGEHFHGLRPDNDCELYRTVLYKKSVCVKELRQISGEIPVSAALDFVEYYTVSGC